MPRFVILTHDHPVLHWDLMLEAGAALRTWRLEKPPAPGQRVAAAPLGEHRLAYLDYEGPVSGNRGSVSRWDWGDYTVLHWSDDEILVQVRGAKLCGSFHLVQSSGAWHFEFAENRNRS